MIDLAPTGSGNPQPSRQLIHEWTGYIKVAIWDECSWTVRLYADRALLYMPEQTEDRLHGSGSYYLRTSKYRIDDGPTLQELRRLVADNGEADNVLELVRRWLDPFAGYAIDEGGTA